MAISKHIFPLVLDGALQAVTASGSSTAWNGLTSYVEVDSSGGNETITLANGTISGTLVTVIKKGATNTITVNPATDFAADQPSVALAEDNEMCTFFWNNSSWRVFNQAEMGGFAGGSVSSLTVTGATALNGGLTMDTDKFTVADTSGNTAIAGTLDVAGNVSIAGDILLTQGAEADAGDNTNAVTAANVLTGIVKCTPTTGRAKATDTATNFISGLALNSNDESFDFVFINLAASSHDVTLSGGTGVTLVGSGVIAANTSVRFRLRRVSDSAVTMYKMS